MSNQVLPVFPGRKAERSRQPQWKTKVVESVSGREYRARMAPLPRYLYRQSYEVLRQGRMGLVELNTLMGFYNQHGGDADSWLYNDLEDNTATAQPFGVGDGSTGSFQLVRTLGGFAEPVFEPAASIAVQVNGVNQYSSARTNQALQSVALEAAGWARTALTVTVTTGPAPDGTTTARKLADTAVTGEHFTQASGSVVSGQTYCLAVRVLAHERSRVEIITNNTPNVGLGFDLAAGQPYATALAAAPAASGMSALGSGWWLCWFVFTAGATGAINPRFYFSNGSSTNYLGDGSGLYLWGLQLEVGSAPTEHILTTAAAVTKAADYTSAKGLLAFATPPAAAAPLTWSGQYYWRCRFLQPQMEFKRFMAQLWQLGSMDFITCPGE